MKPQSLNIEDVRCQSFRNLGKQVDVVRLEDFAVEFTLGKRMHRHNYYLLFLPTSGKGRQLIDFQSYKIEPNMIFLMYPGQVHAWQDIRHLKGILIFFTAEFFSLRYHNNTLFEFPFFHTSCEHPYIELEDAEQAKLQALAGCMLKEFELARTDYLRVLRSYLNILLIECNRMYDTHQHHYHSSDQNAVLIVRNFEKLIEHHFHQKHQVKDYAKLLLITPNYLNAVCKRIRAHSAGELIRQRIMLEAKRMLLQDDLTIAEIGHQLHFEDNSYFSRFFKKYEGGSPEQFRKQFKKAE